LIVKLVLATRPLPLAPRASACSTKRPGESFLPLLRPLN
jgi:hypothetical protein